MMEEEGRTSDATSEANTQLKACTCTAEEGRRLLYSVFFR